MSINNGLKSIFEYLYDNFNILTSNNTLTVEGLNYEDEHCLYINKHNRDLYCLELASSKTTLDYLDNSFYDDLFKDYVEFNNSFYVTACLKDKIHQKIYMFANNKQILDLVRENMKVRFVDRFEMLNVLYDLFLDQVYTIDYKTKKREVDLSEKIRYESIHTQFNKVVKNCVYQNLSDNVKESMKLYYGYRYKEKNRPIDFARLFQLDWTGVIWTYTDVSSSKVINKLDSLVSQSGQEGKDKKYFRALKERYETGEIDLAIRNTSMFLRETTNATINMMSKELNIDFREKKLFNRKNLRYTPLKKRDTDADYLVEKTSTLYNSIATCHKEDVPKPNFWALDINNSFWTFNFAQVTSTKFTKNSNFLILGVTGSGKTTYTNGMIARTIGFDLDENLKLSDEQIQAKDVNEVIKEIDTQYMRIFDIKNSSKKLYNQLKRVKSNDVKGLEADLNNFKYNPFNISYKLINKKRVIDENELSINCSLLSIALESKTGNKKAGIEIGEEDILKNAIKNLYNKNSKSPFIRKLKDDGYENIYKRLVSLGYCNLDKISDIKEEEFNFLKVPTLKNVIAEVRIDTSKETDKIKKEDGERLLNKLSNIDSLNIFSGYDMDNIELAKYLYMDFEKVKDTKEYVPIFIALFNKIFNKDKTRQRELEAKGIERPYITILFEEAGANVFTTPSFELYMNKVTSECRSDRIKVGFVAQLVSQVPSYVYEQVGHTFLLFPAESKKAMLIDQVCEKTKPTDEIVQLMKKSPEYSVVEWNDHGASNIMLPMSENEIDYYGQKQ